MRQESKLKSRYKKSRCGVEEISLEKSISTKKLKVGGRYDVHAWVRLPMPGCLHASVSFPLFSSLSHTRAYQSALFNSRVARSRLSTRQLERRKETQSGLGGWLCCLLLSAP